MMIMCRQVAKALAEHHYWDLPWHRRIPMFIHIRLCAMCGNYHQQVVDMQKGVHHFLEHEELESVKTDEHLSDEARERMLAAIQEVRQKNEEREF